MKKRPAPGFAVSNRAWALFHFLQVQPLDPRRLPAMSHDEPAECFFFREQACSHSLFLNVLFAIHFSSLFHQPFFKLPQLMSADGNSLLAIWITKIWQKEAPSKRAGLICDLCRPPSLCAKLIFRDALCKAAERNELSRSAACVKCSAPTALRKAESDERPLCTASRSNSATDNSCSDSEAAANGQPVVGSSVAIAMAI